MIWGVIDHSVMDFQGMAPVSDDGWLKSGPSELSWMTPGETESGSAGTQPDKG